MNTMAETAGRTDLIHCRQAAAQLRSQLDNSEICQGAHKYKEHAQFVMVILVYTTKAYGGTELQHSRCRCVVSFTGNPGNVMRIKPILPEETTNQTERM